MEHAVKTLMPPENAAPHLWALGVLGDYVHNKGAKTIASVVVFPDGKVASILGCTNPKQWGVLVGGIEHLKLFALERWIGGD